MQRLTKYRLVVFALTLVTVGAVTYSVLLHLSQADLRDEAARSSQRAAESEKKLAQREAIIARMKIDATDTMSSASACRQTAAAFAHQIEVCQGIQQQSNFTE